MSLIIQALINQALINQARRQVASLRYLWLSIITALMVIGCDSATINDEQTIDPPKMSVNDIKSLKPSPSLNVVSPDWGIAATLAAMGQPPIATGDIRVWDQWVGKPELPASTQDLGIRYLPNAELIAQLPTDLLIDNSFYEHSRTLYSGNVPTESVMFKSEKATADWEDFARPTRKLGALIDQPKLAEDYITKSHDEIEQAGKRLHRRYPQVKKFAVVQFIDANNLRMYAANSLFNAAFTQMDRKLVALGEGNGWGFVSIQMGDLARLDNDVCLLVIEPLSPIAEAQLADSLVWQRLGYGNTKVNNVAGMNDVAGATGKNSRCMAKLPPIWIYGGMASLTNLADNLADATLMGGPAS